MGVYFTDCDCFTNPSTLFSHSHWYYMAIQVSGVDYV